MLIYYIYVGYDNGTFNVLRSFRKEKDAVSFLEGLAKYHGRHYGIGSIELD